MHVQITVGGGNMSKHTVQRSELPVGVYRTIRRDSHHSRTGKPIARVPNPDTYTQPFVGSTV